MAPFNCIIMGAAGRDFHDFLTFFKDNKEFRVCCFTADQIPGIEERSFPASLAKAAGYDGDIPIYPEEKLEEVIEKYQAEFVFLSYSDLAHMDVMHKASRVQAAGASFALLGPNHTQLKSNKPVIAVTAVRTGAGKSPLSQALTAHFSAGNKKVGVLRHPMPYGDLEKQAVQKFAEVGDLDKHECTVEEREEYWPYIERGLVIFAGVDYAGVLKAAEQDSDLVLWDGGNNDTPFIKPDLWFVVADALRPGHEVSYYPGETNLRAADVIIINKVANADPKELEAMRERIKTHAPKAKVVEADLTIEVSDEAAIKGKRVLAIEDGPTVTHGSMPYGAAAVAAKRFGAGEIIDASKSAVGSIAEAYVKYSHMDKVLPAVGYSELQLKELKQTIEGAKPDVVLDASPAQVGGMLQLDMPVVRVRYAFKQVAGPDVIGLVDELLKK